MQRGAGTLSPVWTAREREVLDLIARGRTNGEIAEALGITFATAKWHVSELITKLGVQSREEVASYWQAERGPRARLRRFVHGILSFAALKFAAGGALAGSAALGGAAVWVHYSRSDGGDPPIAVNAATPIATRAPGQERFSIAVQGTDGCFPTYERGRPLCDYHRYPEIAKLDKGNCDFSGIVFPPGGAMTQMNYIDLHGCNLSGAVLRGMAANSADFSGADLSGADLSGGSFAGTDFRGANLTAATADPGVFQRANFEGSNLTRANFANAIVTPGNWRNTTCPDGSNSDTHGGTCIGTPGLENPPTTYATGGTRAGICPGDGTLQPPGFLCPVSSIPALQGKELAGCDYTAVDLSGLVLLSVDFRGCTLIAANLSGAKLGDASFARATLPKATLAGAMLRGVDFSGADLQDVDLSGALLLGAKFADADLSRAIFRGGVIDAFWSNTTCPDGTNSDLDDGDAKTCAYNLAP